MHNSCLKICVWIFIFLFLTKLIQNIISEHYNNTSYPAWNFWRNDTTLPWGEKFAPQKGSDSSGYGHQHALENGENLRKPNREHIGKLVEVFGLNSEELLLAFLCDRVAYQLTQESTSEQVLRVAEEKIKYICFKNTIQVVFEF